MTPYSIFQALPIIKTIVKITNNYVYEGDVRATTEIAPIKLWLKSIGAPLFIAALLTVGTLHELVQFCEGPQWDTAYLKEAIKNPGNLLSSVCVNPITDAAHLKEASKTPGDLVIDIFPDLLGFGIGVYALIFALSPKTLRFLQTHLAAQIEKSVRNAGSVLMLNASMGYPVLVLTLCLVLAVFQRIFPDNLAGIVVTWFGFWYGIVVIIELIGVLFALGEHDALDKLDDQTEHGDSRKATNENVGAIPGGDRHQDTPYR